MIITSEITAKVPSHAKAGETGKSLQTQLVIHHVIRIPSFVRSCQSLHRLLSIHHTRHPRNPHTSLLVRLSPTRSRRLARHKLPRRPHRPTRSHNLRHRRRTSRRRNRPTTHLRQLLQRTHIHIHHSSTSILNHGNTIQKTRQNHTHRALRIHTHTHRLLHRPIPSNRLIRLPHPKRQHNRHHSISHHLHSSTNPHSQTNNPLPQKNTNLKHQCQAASFHASERPRKRSLTNTDSTKKRKNGCGHL
jgi:hypothetical protein